MAFNSENKTEFLKIKIESVSKFNKNSGLSQCVCQYYKMYYATQVFDLFISRNIKIASMVQMLRRFC